MCPQAHRGANGDEVVGTGDDDAENRSRPSFFDEKKAIPVLGVVRKAQIDEERVERHELEEALRFSCRGRLMDIDVSDQGHKVHEHLARRALIVDD
jgi:hypothetical protein